MFLATWNYTKEEWMQFIFWKNRKKGFVYALIKKHVPVKKLHIPEITIAYDRVWIDEDHKPFHGIKRQFSEILIWDAGSIHILEIRFEEANCIKNIKVPIPKGKLREAFEMQERLLLDNFSIVKAGGHQFGNI